MAQAWKRNTSALRMAQGSARIYLDPVHHELLDAKKNLQGRRYPTFNVIHKLRWVIKSFEAGAGGEIKAATVLAAKTIRRAKT